MSDLPAELRTVEDAADDAVALLRNIDAEREEHPIAKPPVTDRFTARLVDFVVNSVVAVTVAHSVHRTLRPPPEFAPAPATTNPADPLEPILWGPVAVHWTTAVGLGLAVLAIIALEVVQTRILGATVGKRWHHIRVVDARRGAPASSLQISIRSAVLAVLLVVMIAFWFVSILYAWTALFLMVVIAALIRGDERHQGGHDKLARTEVFTAD